MKHFSLAGVLMILVAGCSTYSGSTGVNRTEGCLDASRAVRKFEQVGSREVLVTVDVNRVYLVGAHQ